MAVVLGIDAAWTADQPSGVALVRGRGRAWTCVAIAPSYASFLALAEGRRVDWAARPIGGAPDPDALLAACGALAGARPEAIAIDMPLALAPITARRAADDAIASAFGRHGLGAHSPNAARPGPIAARMRRGLAAHGYTLATTTTAPGTPGVMLEVFPHAALLGMLGASYRVPYKLARAAQYWPALAPLARRRMLLARWRLIRRALATRIADIPLRIPRHGPLAALKRHEDALDALICAWVGIEYLAGRARPYGDASGSVWT